MPLSRAVFSEMLISSVARPYKWKQKMNERRRSEQERVDMMIRMTTEVQVVKQNHPRKGRRWRQATTIAVEFLSDLPNIHMQA